MPMPLRVLLLLLSVAVAIPVQAEPLTVKVKGGEKRMRANVRLHLDDLDTRELVQPRRLEGRIRRATLRAMDAVGYAAPTFQIEGVKRGSDTVTVTLVDPGKRTRFNASQIQLTGDGLNDAELHDWIEQQQPVKGDTLDHGQYERFKRELMRLCRQRGYFDARFTLSALEVNRQTRRATVRIHLDTGRRYAFGPVMINGSSLEPRRLRRFIRFKPGTPWTEREITDVYKSMIESAWFRDVTIDPRRDAVDGNQIPLTIEVDDYLAHRFNVGAGYGTDSGVRTRFQWSKPMINRYGHSTGATAELNELRKSVSFDYKIPDGHPARDYFLAQAAYIDEYIDDDNVVSTTYTFSHNHERKDGWIQNLFVKLRQEKSDADISESFFVTPGFAYSHLELIGGMTPTRGHRYLFDTEFSDTALGSDTPYAKGHALAKWLMPIAREQQLLIRTEGGTIIADDFDGVPKTSRFYAGGDQSIRGYAFQSLGPLDVKGSAAGAKHLTVGSLEHLWHFDTRWKWATFVDHGRVFNDNDEPWVTGAGFGIRWLSPVGHIGVDIASRVDHPDNDSGFRLHIFMGPPL